MAQLAAAMALQGAPRSPWAPRAAAAAAAAGVCPAHQTLTRLPPSGGRSRRGLARLRVAYQEAPSSSDTDEDASYYKAGGTNGVGGARPTAPSPSALLAQRGLPGGRLPCV